MDILQAAKEIAIRDGQTAGQVISELARRGLASQSPGSTAGGNRGGVPLLPSRGEVVTLEKVRNLLDAEGV